MNPDILYKIHSAFLDFKYISLMINDVEYIEYTNSNHNNNLFQKNLFSIDKNIKCIDEFVYIPVDYIFSNDNMMNLSQLTLKMKLPDYSNVLIPYFYTYKENKIVEIKKKYLKNERNIIILDILPTIVKHLKLYHNYMDYSYSIRVLISKQKPNSTENSISSFNNYNYDKFKYYTYFDIICKIKYSYFTLQILSPTKENLALNKELTIPNEIIVNIKKSHNNKILSSILLLGFMCLLILAVYCVFHYKI